MPQFNLDIAFASNTQPADSMQNWPPAPTNTPPWPPPPPQGTSPYNVIAAMYGFTYPNPSNNWLDAFQHVPIIQPNTLTMFTPFDVSDTAAGSSPLITISQIVIYVAQYSSPDPGQPSSPVTSSPFDTSGGNGYYGWPSDSPSVLIVNAQNASTYGLSSMTGAAQTNSTGLNVKCRAWGIGPFKFLNPGMNGNQPNMRYYELTIGIYGTVVITGTDDSKTTVARVFSVDPEMEVQGTG